jgi:hypothetical protein
VLEFLNLPFKFLYVRSEYSNIVLEYPNVVFEYPNAMLKYPNAMLKYPNVMLEYPNPSLPEGLWECTFRGSATPSEAEPHASRCKVEPCNEGKELENFVVNLPSEPSNNRLLDGCFLIYLINSISPGRHVLSNQGCSGP